MHVDRIPNRTSPPAYLLRETYREGEKVKKRTLANISDWPIAKIEALRRVLRGDFSSNFRLASPVQTGVGWWWPARWPDRSCEAIGGHELIGLAPQDCPRAIAQPSLKSGRT